MGHSEIVKVEQHYTAAVKAIVAFDDLPAAERSARDKLADALPFIQAEPPGAGFTLCRLPSGGRMHLEPGVIVTGPFDAIGDVVASQLPAGRAIRQLHVGPLEKLPEAWPALFTWSMSKGLRLEGAFWQIYGSTTADPAEQQTTLYALLAK